MAKKHPIIEDFAQRQVREYEETKAKLDVANAMLAALKGALPMMPKGEWDHIERTRRRAVVSAIAQAEAAGIGAVR